MVTNDYDEEYMPQINTAVSLPSGWAWYDYSDGSGSLYCKDTKKELFFL